MTPYMFIISKIREEDSMPAAEEKKKATKKYIENNLERLTIRVKKGNKEIIKAHADAQKESINEFVARAIQETMERDKAEK